MKEKDISIKLVSTQSDGKNSDKTEIFSVGKYHKSKDGYVISYEESELTGFKGCKSYITVYDGGDRVDLERKGDVSSNLIIERNKRYHCMYRITEGSIMLGVSGTDINSNLNENGGSVDFHYTLDANSQYIGDFDVSLDIKVNSIDS